MGSRPKGTHRVLLFWLNLFAITHSDIRKVNLLVRFRFRFICTEVQFIIISVVVAHVALWFTDSARV